MNPLNTSAVTRVEPRPAQPVTLAEWLDQIAHEATAPTTQATSAWSCALLLGIRLHQASPVEAATIADVLMDWLTALKAPRTTDQTEAALTALVRRYGDAVQVYCEETP